MPINRRELLGAASSVLATWAMAGSTSSAATAPATIGAIPDAEGAGMNDLLDFLPY